MKNDNEIFKPCISVIVPVYNTKEYLKQCLDSLKKQTLHEIEILIIDDGSTDGSSEICDKYARDDIRFRVVHKNNEGLASARNDGIRYAKSEYIMYVDSDDWVEPQFCEEPYKKAIKENADIVCFQYYRITGNEERRQPKYPVDGIVQKTDVLSRYWTYTYATSMNKLYRKDLFCGIIYPVGHFSEDVAVIYKLIYEAKCICFLNSYLYHYRANRPGSICNSGSLKSLKDHMYYIIEMFESLEQQGYDCVKEDKISYAIMYLLRLGRFSELSKKCDMIVRECRIKDLPWKKKIIINLYCISPKLFDFIATLTGKRKILHSDNNDMGDNYSQFRYIEK